MKRLRVLLALLLFWSILPALPGFAIPVVQDLIAKGPEADPRAYMSTTTYLAWLVAPSLVDAAPAFRAAAAAIQTTGGNLIVPSGVFGSGDYWFNSGGIALGDNVNLVGKGGRIHRNFKYDNTALSTTNCVFSLTGNNIVTGITYNGHGESSDVYPGAQSQIYTYYCDFAISSAYKNVKILGNTFKNSPGSFFTSTAESVTMSGNIFLDWLDHCFYVGNSTATTSGNISITGNVFKGELATTTRDPLKFDGNISNIAISGNVFNQVYTSPDMPAIHLGARYNDNGSIGSVSITGNSANMYSGTFVGIYKTTTTDNSYVGNVVVSGNIVNSTYGMSIGTRPTDNTTQNGASVLSMLINGNKFSGTNAWIANGVDLPGIYGIEQLVVSNNVIEVGSTIYFMGNIRDLVFDGNTLVGAGQNNGISFGLPANDGYHWHPGTNDNTFAGHASITNNKYIGVYAGVIESGADATHPSAIGLSIYLAGNQQLGGTHASRRILLTDAAYPPTTTLTVGPGNYATTASTLNPIVWGGPRADMGDASPYGYRTHTDNVNGNLTSFFVGEVALDNTNKIWYKAVVSGVDNEWKALN